MNENGNEKIDHANAEGKNLVVDDTIYKTNLTDKFLRRKAWEKPDDNFVYAFIPGTVIKLFVKNGQTVKKGEKLLILEAMKMKNKILAEKAGKIEKVHIQNGDVVTKGQLLITYSHLS
jgi:biotin carboxyl carrier protein